MIFPDARCPVPNCPHSHGEEGCNCGFAGYGDPCLHPEFKRRWAKLEAIRQKQEQVSSLEPAPAPAKEPGLTARLTGAMRTSTPLTPVQARERALQLAMELGYP